jgi:hypothetical protein
VGRGESVWCEGVGVGFLGRGESVWCEWMGVGFLGRGESVWCEGVRVGVGRSGWEWVGGVGGVGDRLCY